MRIAGGVFWLVAFMGTELVAQSVLLLDRSGSMRSYYEIGFPQEVAAEILEQGIVSHIALFGEQYEELPDLEIRGLDGMPFYPNTLLDRAVREASSRYGKAWLLTDNIQDTGETRGNTEAFYAFLQSDEVVEIVVFPFVQDPGQNGLILYYLVFKGDSSAGGSVETDQTVARLIEHFNTTSLIMKPLGQDMIDMVEAPEAPGSDGIERIDVGRPLTGSVYVRFRSRLPHIGIQEAAIRLPPAHTPFDGGSILYTDRVDLEVTPEKIIGLPSGSETQEVFKVTYDFGTIRLKKDFQSLWRAAWEKASETATIDFPILLLVRSENLYFEPEFLKRFNAATLEQAAQTGKVYAIDRLPLLLMDSVVQIDANSRVIVRVNYPWWPAPLWLLLFGLVLILLAVSGVGAVRHFRPGEVNWLVSASGAGGSKIRATVSDSADVILLGETIGHIEHTPWRYKFVPSDRIVVEGDEDQELKLTDEATISIILKKVPYVLTFRETDTPTGTTTKRARNG